MFLRTKSITAAVVLGFTSLGAEVLAQQTQPNNPAPSVQQQPQRRPGMRRRAMRARAGRAHALQQLNLTDQQKEQMRTLMQGNRQSTLAQRQEMRQLTQQWRQGTLTPEGLERAKALRAQLAENRKAMRGQMEGILTADQKAKLEEMKSARRANRERFGKRNQPPIQE